MKAPIVIGRDHLDTGSVASPNRETEAMVDSADAASDWPLLNLLRNTAAGYAKAIEVAKAKGRRLMMLKA